MKRSFVYGTMVLLAANLLNRCLAFLYQYLIMSWIGAEAYGIYQMVFPTYVMILVLTCAGIPLAVSKLVSEQVALGNRKNAAKIFRIALLILLGSGLVISVLVYTLVPKIAGPLFPDPRVYPVFLVCVPAIFIVAASSAFRGYFQGLQDMAPTALAQVCEQVTRVSIGTAMAVKFLALGVEYGAVGLALGMVCGEFVGFLTLLLVYRHNRKKLQDAPESTTQPFSTITKQLFGIGLPVTAGRLVASGAQAVDSFIIPLRLQAAGYSLRETTTLYGQLGGAAFTLLTFPTVFTFSLATSLVPAISEAQAQNKPVAIRHKAGEAIRYTVLIGMPFLIFIYFFGTELSSIFKSPNAGGALSTMAIAGIFLYLQSTTTGILQGLGHPQIPVIHTIVGSLLKLVFLYNLTAMPSLGIVGTAWSYNFAFLCVSSLNLVAIMRKTGLRLNLERLILQPLSAACLMGSVMYFAKNYLLQTPSLLPFEFITGLTIYSIVLFLNKGLTKDDLKRIPLFGKYIPA